MKKTLAIVLALFATSAIAEGNPQFNGAQSPAIDDARSPSVALETGWEVDLSDPDRAIAPSVASAPFKVLYEVTLSRDGKLLKSYNILTDNGKQGTAASEEITPYLASCDAATGCSAAELRSSVNLALTPRVGADGSILTACKIDVSTTLRADDFSTISDFFLLRGQETTISHNGLSLTIRAKVV
ncbi:hypothetical protein H3V53_14875 [Paraburkholderia bengalensis]|uniref:Uncharacterized protein n=1 Tax=Paraburkholderia bengalensis TaxID=2747562 RepID=A0ABU8IS35_9BURK